MIFKFIVPNDEFKNIYTAKKKRFDNLYKVTWSTFELFYDNEYVEAALDKKDWLVIEEKEFLNVSELEEIKYELESMIDTNKYLEKQGFENYKVEIEHYESIKNKLNKFCNIRIVRIADDVMLINEDKIITLSGTNKYGEYFKQVSENMIEKEMWFKLLKKIKNKTNIMIDSYNQRGTITRVVDEYFKNDIKTEKRIVICKNIVSKLKEIERCFK